MNRYLPLPKVTPPHLRCEKRTVKPLPVENRMKEDISTYAAAASVDECKEIYKTAIQRNLNGDLTRDECINLSFKARKIANKLDNYPDFNGISEHRFNAHLWADRIQGLVG